MTADVAVTKPRLVEDAEDGKSRRNALSHNARTMTFPNAPGITQSGGDAAGAAARVSRGE